MKELEGLIDLAESHPFVIDMATSGTLDLSNSAGRMVARMMVTVTANESERKAERHQDKAAQLRSQGKSQGGSRPFGWEAPNGALRPSEATLVYWGIKSLLKGKDERETLYSIRKTWNASGLSTSSHRTQARLDKIDGGGAWPNNKAVARILTRYRNAGLMEHQGKVVGPAVWPAIEVPDHPAITEEDVTQVRLILSDPDRKTTPGPARKHLMSGLARCGKCGYTLRKGAQARAKGSSAYYRCSNQPFCYLSIQVLALDELINAEVIRHYTFGDVAKMAPSKTDQDQLAALRTEKAQIDRTTADIAKSVGSGAWTMQMAEIATQGLLERLEEIKRTQRVISARFASAEMLMEPVVNDDGAFGSVEWGRLDAVKTRWESLTLEKKRAIVSELYEAVIVKPGRGDADERVILTKNTKIGA